MQQIMIYIKVYKTLLAENSIINLVAKAATWRACGLQLLPVAQEHLVVHQFLGVQWSPIGMRFQGIGKPALQGSLGLFAIGIKGPVDKLAKNKGCQGPAEN